MRFDYRIGQFGPIGTDVTVDGVRLAYVVALDTDEGWALCHDVDENGNRVAFGGSVATVLFWGEVSLVPNEGAGGRTRTELCGRLCAAKNALPHELNPPPEHDPCDACGCQGVKFDRSKAIEPKAVTT